MDKKKKEIINFLISDCEEELKEEIQIIPMIDVMLFLLVFFMLYTLNVLPMYYKNINIPKSSNYSQRQANKIMVIYITKEGNIMINQKSYSLDSLKLYLNSLGDKNIDVLIVPDKSISIQKVISVLDVIQNSGIKKVSVSVEKNG